MQGIVGIDVNTGFEGMGKMLITLGAFMLLIGLFLTYSGRLFGGFRLPGDIIIRRGNFTFYFPIMTSILLSLVLTVIGWIIMARR